MIAVKEYLRAKAKRIVVANLEDGDVLKIKSQNIPFIYHYVIVFREHGELFIYHNQPDKINKYGGSLIREPFTEYIKGKEIVAVENLNTSYNNFSEIFDVLMTEKYDVFKNNCEHYINYIKEKKYSSPQVASWIIIASIVTTFYLLNRKK